MTRVPELRLRTLNELAVRDTGRYVLYWMVAARRLTWNYALDRALEHAEELRKPLLVFEPISVDYPWACDRHHAAILDGMREHRERLSRTSVAYFPYVEPMPGAGKGLLSALAGAACVVVTDDSPVFLTPSLLRAAARLDRCRVEAVDSCGLLPLRAHGKAFGAAYHFRRFLQRELPEHLTHLPSSDPLASVKLPPTELPTDVLAHWPAAHGLLDAPDALSGLPIDHSVPSTEWVGGHRPALQRLEHFLAEDLADYAERRNHPDAGVSSRLSPWLHYGHLSAHEVFHAVATAESWSPARIAPPSDGRRRGWWGMSAGAEAFLDQVVTWRELGYGFSAHEPDYDRYTSLPAWARETLEHHAADPRPDVYALDRLAAASTHDELWNAAQRQLVSAGTIHNYLRMLWGKKILEWTRHPREALEVMIELNNRYALDGRDPNSYSGIFWTLGRFDRGWPERPIYGKVRSMSSDLTRRKVDVTEYLARWARFGGSPEA